MIHARAGLAIVLPALIAGASVLALARMPRAADASVYRADDFDKAAADIMACTSDSLQHRYPGLHLGIEIAPQGPSLVGRRSTADSSAFWKMLVQKTGESSSYVELLNKSATAVEIKDVWDTMAACATE